MEPSFHQVENKKLEALLTASDAPIFGAEERTDLIRYLKEMNTHVKADDKKTNDWSFYYGKSQEIITGAQKRPVLTGMKRLIAEHFKMKVYTISGKSSKESMITKSDYEDISLGLIRHNGQNFFGTSQWDRKLFKTMPFAFQDAIYSFSHKQYGISCAEKDCIVQIFSKESKYKNDTKPPLAINKDLSEKLKKENPYKKFSKEEWEAQKINFMHDHLRELLSGSTSCVISRNSFDLVGCEACAQMLAAYGIIDTVQNK